MSQPLSRAEVVRTESALETEWLVTNGLGGFASGTIAQANTRRYHGLLIAALRPPVERVVMVSKLEITADYLGHRQGLGCNEFADGTLSPHGYRLLERVHLEQGLPVWTYALGDARLEQRVWMEHGRNTTYVRLTLHAASASMRLELLPLCTYRDYHQHSRGGWSLRVTPEASAVSVTAFNAARPYRLCVDRGDFEPHPDWYWNFLHRAERERGLDAVEDLFKPGVFHVELTAGESVTLQISADASHTALPGDPLARERERRTGQRLASRPDAPPWIRHLTFSADQFIVARESKHSGESGTTVIAGYPWFSDWGRDTMIALPGLTLATGRIGDAAAILRTFARYVDRGLIPNRFPDAGEAPEYNTADATLWLFHALDACLQLEDDPILLADLFPTLQQIVRSHREGTRYGIRADAEDGLLYAGERGVQLTWMDAKVGDWVVTPRIGKPVEINALWHFALDRMARWAARLGEHAAERDYERAAARVRQAFAQAFWYEQGGHLYDVIDARDGEPDGAGRLVDRSVRPNQIFALSLGTDLLDADRARSVLSVCARELLTPVGLRSLAPGDERYVGVYSGGVRQRDGAYHQGTVWSWLLGPFALAHYRVYGDANTARGFLEGLAPHLNEACLGSISEIFDGDAPHLPRGCIAQAWSVAETLRAWRVLTADLQGEPT